jgi:hypothetical protein
MEFASNRRVALLVHLRDELCGEDLAEFDAWRTDGVCVCVCARARARVCVWRVCVCARTHTHTHNGVATERNAR